MALLDVNALVALAWDAHVHRRCSRVRLASSRRARCCARCASQGHRFLSDDVSLADPEIPRLVGHRQVTDAHLLALARRNDTRLLTFDAAAVKLARGDEFELLTALA